MDFYSGSMPLWASALQKATPLLRESAVWAVETQNFMWTSEGWTDDWRQTHSAARPFVLVGMDVNEWDP